MPMKTCVGGPFDGQRIKAEEQYTVLPISHPEGMLQRFAVYEHCNDEFPVVRCDFVTTCFGDEIEVVQDLVEQGKIKRGEPYRRENYEQDEEAQTPPGSEPATEGSDGADADDTFGRERETQS